MCEVATNAHEILRGYTVKADYSGLQTVDEIGVLARTRWLVPRAERRPEFKEWKRAQFRNLVSTKHPRNEAGSAPPQVSKVEHAAKVDA